MKLPVLSAKKVIKILIKMDFKIARQSGSHVILVKFSGSEKATVVVPNHNELAKGTLLSIISQSGLNKDEFLKLV